MTIVFDMDNTLTDEFGSTVRPGIVKLLERLKKDGHTLTLWTNSKRDRAKEILRQHDLMRFFTVFVYRENYDPQEKGLPKDIRKIKGDLLVDDDPSEIEYVKSIRRKTFKITPYRKGSHPGVKELSELYRSIGKASSLFEKLFG